MHFPLLKSIFSAEGRACYVRILIFSQGKTEQESRVKIFIYRGWKVYSLKEVSQVSCQISGSIFVGLKFAH